MAKQDVFGRNVATFGGAMSADDALMTFPGVVGLDGANQRAAVPLLLQGGQFDYQQQITRIYDLSSSNIYYVAGRAAGQGSLEQVLGPQKLSIAFLRTYGSVCRAGRNTLNFTLTAGCNHGEDSTDKWRNSQNFAASYVVIERVGIRMAAQSMVIQKQLAMTFGSLDYKDQAGAAGGGVALT